MVAAIVFFMVLRLARDAGSGDFLFGPAPDDGGVTGFCSGWGTEGASSGFAAEV